MLLKCPAKEDIFKGFTREIRNFSEKQIIFEKLSRVSNNFVSGAARPLIGERFCAPCTRKPPNGPSKNLLGTGQGS